MYFFKRLCDGSRARSPIRDVPRKAGAQKYAPDPPSQVLQKVVFAAFYAAISPPGLNIIPFLQFHRLQCQ